MKKKILAAAIVMVFVTLLMSAVAFARPTPGFSLMVSVTGEHGWITVHTSQGHVGSGSVSGLPMGENITISIVTDPGYVMDSKNPISVIGASGTAVQLSPSTVPGTDYAFTMPPESVTVSANFLPKQLEVLEGDKGSYQVGTGKPYVFTLNQKALQIIQVTVDGKTAYSYVNYTVEDASEDTSTVSFKSDYLAKLSSGEHTFVFISSNQTRATATITVSSPTPPSPTSSPSVPATGDAASPALLFALLAIASLGIFLTVSRIRRLGGQK